MIEPSLRTLPEALLAVYGILVFGWFASSGTSMLLLVPVAVAALGIAHIVGPAGLGTRIGLVVAYVGGGLIASFLLLGFMIPGGAPEDYAAHARVATPLLGLFALSLVTLVVKFR